MEIEGILLPERRISIDKTTYFIHGLVHGNSWIQISPLFKKEIGKQLKDNHVICEDGFVDWIPRAVSIGEIEYFNFRRFSFFQKLCFCRDFAKYFLSSTKQDLEIVSKVREMSSIEDLLRIREYLFRQYLPEPEGMNTLMEKENSGTIDSPNGNVPLRVRRYIYEAKVSLDYAQQRELEKLHIVVGCAHELPLEFLLSHQEILDKYFL